MTDKSRSWKDIKLTIMGQEITGIHEIEYEETPGPVPPGITMTFDVKLTQTANNSGRLQKLSQAWEDVAMSPVIDPNPESENGKFFAATPGGTIQLGVVSEQAATFFEQGQEYYVYFSKEPLH
jgi:hypothetical protein